MNHVIAFDVSMGKSFMVIYNPLKQCVFEGEINHSRLDLDNVKVKIEQLIEGYRVPPEIVFEANGVYSKPLERFMNENNFAYCLLNPLEAKIQCDSLRIHKTDRSDANILVGITITIITSIFGIQSYLISGEYLFLIAFSLIAGFSGAIISLLISRMMAKWLMNVQLINERSPQGEHELFILEETYRLARIAGLKKMPQVGIYHFQH